MLTDFIDRYLFSRFYIDSANFHPEEEIIFTLGKGDIPKLYIKERLYYYVLLFRSLILILDSLSSNHKKEISYDSYLRLNEIIEALKKMQLCLHSSSEIPSIQIPVFLLLNNLQESLDRNDKSKMSNFWKNNLRSAFIKHAETVTNQWLNVREHDYSLPRQIIEMVEYWENTLFIKLDTPTIMQPRIFKGGKSKSKRAIQKELRLLKTLYKLGKKEFEMLKILYDFELHETKSFIDLVPTKSCKKLKESLNNKLLPRGLEIKVIRGYGFNPSFYQLTKNLPDNP